MLPGTSRLRRLHRLVCGGHVLLLGLLGLVGLVGLIISWFEISNLLRGR